MKIENNEAFIKFHNDMYDLLPGHIKAKAIAILTQEFSFEVKELIRVMYERDPVHWCAPLHFTWGMGVRNLLRDKVCLDDKLSSNKEHANWDNFYVKLVEVACGCY